MARKNLPKQKIVRIGDVEYVPAPNLDGVPRLKKPGTPEERRAAAKERSKRPRPRVTSWVDEKQSLVVQDNGAGTKTLTRCCPVCQRWFRIVRETGGRARWPETCSEECKVTNRRERDAERQRRKRARDKMPQKYRYETIDCDRYRQDELYDLLECKEVTEKDGVVYRKLSPEARATIEAYLKEQEEWESWASN